MEGEGDAIESYSHHADEASMWKEGRGVREVRGGRREGGKQRCADLTARKGGRRKKGGVLS